jgi:hypothetical protein
MEAEKYENQEMSSPRCTEHEAGVSHFSLHISEDTEDPDLTMFWTCTPHIFKHIQSPKIREGSNVA